MQRRRLKGRGSGQTALQAQASGRSGMDSGRMDHAKTQFCPSTCLTRADEGGGSTEGILLHGSTEHCHPLNLARWIVQIIGTRRYQRF